MSDLTVWRNESAPYLAPYDWINRPVGNKLEKLRAAGRPASERETAENLALLLKAFPNAGAADGEIFGAMLVEDIAAMQPTIGDLQEACRWLRRTSRFLPTISEVLEALSLAREQREMWISSMPYPKSTAPLEPPKPQLEHRQDVSGVVVLDGDRVALPARALEETRRQISIAIGQW